MTECADGTKQIYGIHPESKGPNLSLLYQVAEAIANVNVDEDHTARRYAQCLRDLIQKVDRAAVPNTTFESRNVSEGDPEAWSKWLAFQTEPSLMAVSGDYQMDELFVPQQTCQPQ